MIKVVRWSERAWDIGSKPWSAVEKKDTYCLISSVGLFYFLILRGSNV